MAVSPTQLDAVARAINRDRLLDTAVRLISVSSPTDLAGPALDALESILKGDGFEVERLAAGHATGPAVVVRHSSGRPGRTIQFDGHVDTVHLPFIPPSIAGDLLLGSGASDMKGGMAAAVEALRAIRDAGLLPAGSVLLTAHDQHEAPWGFGEQLDRLIADGLHGDGVLIPEPLADVLPVVGRGQACWKISLRRQGRPVHEVMRPRDEPCVIAAGAELVQRLGRLEAELTAAERGPYDLAASVFIGQFHSGELYNQFPQECLLEGTRRWLPGTSRLDVEVEFRSILAGIERDTGTTITLDYQLVRDSFALDASDRLVASFQAAHEATAGVPLPLGSKPFVDDCNSFSSLARIPAITHGPRAGGQHTVKEWVSIDDLLRVARVYVLTAMQYCEPG